MIAVWLITSTGNPLMPAYWMVATGLVMLLTTIFGVHYPF